jgi:uncharacterized membrane protein
MASPHVPYHSPSAIHAYSVYLMVLQFPVVCFVLALLTDIAYWQTSNLMWTEFSAWLLFGGIIFGCMALIVGGLARLLSRNEHAPYLGWPQLGALAVLLILAFFNNLVHARDGWTSVMPWGLTLSILMTIVIVLLPWLDFARDQLQQRRMKL